MSFYDLIFSFLIEKIFSWAELVDASSRVKSVTRHSSGHAATKNETFVLLAGGVARRSVLVNDAQAGVRRQRR